MRRHHPYKPSARFFPAGFRITDYVPKRCINFFRGPNFTNIRSPDPSPLRSAKGGAGHSDDDDAPPTFRLGDLFGGDIFGSPKRPTAPTPGHPQNAGPNTGPALSQLPIPPPRRKYKPYGRSTSPNLAHRSRDVPPHRGSRWSKRKRAALRTRQQADGFKRRTAQARKDLLRLVEQAETLMKPEHMTDEDRIFLEQLANLELDQKLEHDLELCRQQVIRAAAETEQRQKEHEARDREAEKLCAEMGGEEAHEENKRKVEEFVRKNEEERDAWYQQEEEEAMRVDERRQRAHEVAERKIREAQERRFREELARKMEERQRREKEERQRREQEARRRREEEERRLQEKRRKDLEELKELARRLQEEMEHARRMEMERRRREEEERRLRDEADRLRRVETERRRREEEERRLQDEADRLRREAYERSRRAEMERLAREEEERQAQLRAEQARRAAEEQIRQCFTTYEVKWAELRTNNNLPPIDVRQMPWPVFGVILSADQITYEGVRTFLFHPQRPNMEGKTVRDKVKAEVLRFHPDKFNSRIVPKIYPTHQTIAQEIAGAVTRILTTLMTEEME